VVVAAAVFVAALTGTAGAAPPAPARTPPQAAVTKSIKVGDNFYKPQTVEVTAGTKIKWTNKGHVTHTVTPDKGHAFGTTLKKGKSYKFTFSQPGTYGYYCTFHGSPGAGQYGTIKVVAAPTTTSSAP
jgi:plastocyanin